MAQGSAQVPTTGSESATTFAGQANTAFQAVLSNNSGATAPANGPSSSPMQFQWWADLTVALFAKLRLFDGVNWPFLGTLDVTNSNWLPKSRGGLGTIVSASSCDLASQPQGTLSVTGTTTINDFGTSATVGETRVCVAQGAFTIVNSGSISCPGGANIVAAIGDTFEVEYQGSSLWVILWYTRAAGAPGIGKPTGEIFSMYGKGSIPGALPCNAKTIGNTSSGGTQATGPSVQNLYTWLWNSSALQSATVTITIASPGVVSWAGHGMSVGAAVVFRTTGGLPTGLVVGTVYYVSAAGFGANSFQVADTQAHAIAGTNSINTSGSQSGTQTATEVDWEIVISGTGRGASAAADWAALKTIALPDLNGRMLVGIDGIANRVTSATMTPDGATLGAIGGAQQATLSTAQMPSHAHTITSQPTGTESSGHSHTYGVTFTGVSAGGVTVVNDINTSGTHQLQTGGESATHTHSLTGTTDANGSGSAHNNMPPGKIVSFYIAL